MSRLFNVQTRRRALMVAGALLAQVTAAAAQRRGNEGDECTTPQPNPPPEKFCGICLRAGTAIATPRGPMPVEQIRAGDEVTSFGRTAPVRFVGHFRKEPTLFWRPVRIRTGAIADGTPSRDLVVTPDHAVFIDGLLVPAGDLVNGLTIVEEPLSSGIQTFFHVELDRHDVLAAEGAWVESLRPVHGHAGFDNDDGERVDDPLRLQPFAPIVGLKGGREAARALWLGLRGHSIDPRLAQVQDRLWRRATSMPAARAA